MRSLVIIIFAIVALTGCKEQTARTQEEIRAGENKDRIAKKMVEKAYKQGEEARREGDAGR